MICPPNIFFVFFLAVLDVAGVCVWAYACVWIYKAPYGERLLPGGLQLSFWYNNNNNNNNIRKGNVILVAIVKLKLSPLAYGLVITVLANWRISICSRKLSQRYYNVRNGRYTIWDNYPHLRRGSKLEKYSETNPQIHHSDINCPRLGREPGPDRLNGTRSGHLKENITRSI